MQHRDVVLNHEAQPDGRVRVAARHAASKAKAIMPRPITPTVQMAVRR